MFEWKTVLNEVYVKLILIKEAKFSRTRNYDAIQTDISRDPLLGNGSGKFELSLWTDSAGRAYVMIRHSRKKQLYRLPVISRTTR